MSHPITVHLQPADLDLILRALRDHFSKHWTESHQGSDFTARMNADTEAMRASHLIDTLTPLRDLTPVHGPDPRD